MKVEDSPPVTFRAVPTGAVPIGAAFRSMVVVLMVPGRGPLGALKPGRDEVEGAEIEIFTDGLGDSDTAAVKGG